MRPSGYGAVLVAVLFAISSCRKVSELAGHVKGDQSASADADAPRPAAIPSISCAESKSGQAFITTLTKDLFDRPPTDDEIAGAALASFSANRFVDQALASPDADAGIARFAGSLFATENLAPKNAQDPGEVSFVQDLKREAAVLVQRGKNGPWAAMFSTTDIYCTAQTAKLYDSGLVGEVDPQGFGPCRLPAERAGVMSLVSVLRASSPATDPQAFYRRNNNYHRAAAALYWVSGVQHAVGGFHDAPGDGPVTPPDSCVPTTDMRLDAAGQPFGTAAVSLAGATCSGCHSKSEGPLSIAFRRFGPNGEILSLPDVDALLQSDLGTSAKGPLPKNIDRLKAILAEQHSCWAAVDGQIPQLFVGMPGFAALAAKAPTLGHALGVQLPKHLLQVEGDPNMIASIEAAYAGGGETLMAALRGLLLSDSYRCARQNE